MFSIMMFFAQGSQVRWLESLEKITILLKVELIFLLYLLKHISLSVYFMK